MFTQRLTPEVQRQIIACIKTMLQSRDRLGIKVYAPEDKAACELARQVVTTAITGESLRPAFLTVDETTAVTAQFACATRYQRWTAERTLARIIQREITAERIVLVFTYSSLLGLGFELPEHAIMTAWQYEELGA